MNTRELKLRDLGYITAKYTDTEILLDEIKEIIEKTELKDINLIKIDKKLIEDLREKNIFTIKDLFKKEKLNDLI